MASSPVYTMGGVIALVHSSMADDLVNENRLPSPRSTISGFWKVDLVYQEADRASQSTRLTNHVQDYFGTGLLSAQELQIRDKTQLRPNQYSRPAYLQIMETIQKYRQTHAGAKCSLEDYVLVGAIERANREWGYDIANCDIFGGYMKRGESSAECGIRKMEKEFLVDIRHNVQNVLNPELQGRIRRDLEVPGLPLFMDFRGQLPRQRWIDNMQAWIMIFPQNSIRVKGRAGYKSDATKLERMVAAFAPLTLQDSIVDEPRMLPTDGRLNALVYMLIFYFSCNEMIAAFLQAQPRRQLADDPYRRWRWWARRGPRRWLQAKWKRWRRWRER